MDIFLDSKIITDNKLSSDTIAVYTALRMIQNSNINEYYVNMKLLAYQLSNNLIFSRKYMERLSDGLNELITKKYITIVANNADKDYILDISNQNKRMNEYNGISATKIVQIYKHTFFKILLTG